MTQGRPRMRNRIPEGARCGQAVGAFVERCPMPCPRLPRLPITLVATVLAAATGLATAAGPRDAAKQAGVQPQFTKVVGQKLVSTSVEGDSVHYTLPAGFTNIGVPIKFNCAAACTVMVTGMVQVESTDPYWAICPTIDNVDAVDSCNFQGLMTTSSDVYVTGNGTFFWTLPAGKHTFQAQIYLNVPGGLDNWGMTIGQYQ
jgi:hypothetical protein